MIRERPIDAAAGRFVVAAMHARRHDADLALAQAAAWGAASPEHRAGLWRWVAEHATASLDDDTASVSEPEGAHA